MACLVEQADVAVDEAVAGNEACCMAPVVPSSTGQLGIFSHLVWVVIDSSGWYGTLVWEAEVSASRRCVCEPCKRISIPR